MKNLIFAASLLALSSTAMAATNVGVAITVGDPNFYGRIDIGNFPQPQVIYQQPVLVERPVRYVEAQPIYLRVPPGHAKNWSKHCRAYNACGQRVYFVQDNWYQRDYAPRYRNEHGRRDDHGPRREEYDGRDRDDHRGHDDKDHGKGHDKDHDNGHGNGNGHGRGKD